jgi:ceramide glucosyltransferase
MVFLATAWLLAALVAGSAVFCILVVIAAAKFRTQPLRVWRGPGAPPISILKPLSGLDEGIESNLRTFFEQQYPGSFEILFAVRHASDPAAPVVEKLRAEYPHIPSQLLLTADAPYANRKVWALQKMMAAATYDLLAMSDSDIRVTPAFLASVAPDFADRSLAVTTCPYRAVAGDSFWSRLEAIGLNTEFIGGVLVARMLEGMRFAVGPTIVARRSAIEKLGGWHTFREYLAEDFVLGQRAAEAGMGVGLSRYVIEHHIGTQSFVANMKHRLRWVRSTRRSRPAGYVGELFTKTTALALLLWIVAPGWWPLVVAALWLRIAAASVASGLVLQTSRGAWLLLFQDLLSFVFWFAGFFGNTIGWRGQRYYLHSDGRFEAM